MTGISNFLPLMLGAPQGSSGTGAGGVSLWGTLGMFALIILVFYFLMIRPQNKKQKDAQKMLSSLRKGDRVVTVGGMRGSVVSVKEDSVILKVDDTTKIEFNKSAVTQVLERKDEVVEVKE